MDVQKSTKILSAQEIIKNIKGESSKKLKHAIPDAKLLFAMKSIELLKKINDNDENDEYYSWAKSFLGVTCSNSSSGLATQSDILTLYLLAFFHELFYLVEL